MSRKPQKSSRKSKKKEDKKIRSKKNNDIWPLAPVIVPSSSRLVRKNALANWLHSRKLKLRQELKTKDHRIVQHLNGRMAFPDHKGIICLDDEDSTSSLASSFMDLNREYTFMLKGYSTLGYTSTVINAFFPCDPSASGSNFPEWGDLTPLFSEFKMVEFGVQFCNTKLDSSATQEFQSLAIGGNLGTAGAPGSYATVVDNADSVLWPWFLSTDRRGITHRLKGTDLNWSVVTSPTTTPYAGAPGCIAVYSTGNASPATVIDCKVWGIYKFRSRV